MRRMSEQENNRGQTALQQGWLFPPARFQSLQAQQRAAVHAAENEGRTRCIVRTAIDTAAVSRTKLKLYRNSERREHIRTDSTTHLVESIAHASVHKSKQSSRSLQQKKGTSIGIMYPVCSPKSQNQTHYLLVCCATAELGNIKIQNKNKHEGHIT